MHIVSVRYLMPYLLNIAYVLSGTKSSLAPSLRWGQKTSTSKQDLSSTASKLQTSLHDCDLAVKWFCYFSSNIWKHIPSIKLNKKGTTRKKWLVYCLAHPTPNFSLNGITIRAISISCSDSTSTIYTQQFMALMLWSLASLQAWHLCTSLN